MEYGVIIGRSAEMKQVIECKRACLYEVGGRGLIYIFSDMFNPQLSNRDIECILYNPNTMEWHDGAYWMKNSSMRLEVYTQYREVDTIWDKIIRRFK